VARTGWEASGERQAPPRFARGLSVRGHANFSTSFWTKGSGKRLRGNRDAQLLGAYLITAPGSNLIGLYYLPLVTVCHELGMSPEEARAAFAACSVADLAHYDEEAELVWVPNAAEKELGDSLKANDKRRSAIERELRPFRGHRFGVSFVQRYGKAFGLDSRFETAPEAPLKPLPENQEAPSEGHPRGLEAPGEVSPGKGSDLGLLAGARAADPPEPPASDPAPDMTPTQQLRRREARWRDAVAQGISGATGAPCSFGDQPWQQAHLARAITAHAPPGSRGPALDNWLRGKGKAYGLRVMSTGATVSLEKFAAWLDSGSPKPIAKRDQQGREEPAPAPYHARGIPPPRDGVQVDPAQAMAALPAFLRPVPPATGTEDG
jgi:hypothetical protein